MKNVVNILFFLITSFSCGQGNEINDRNSTRLSVEIDDSEPFTSKFNKIFYLKFNIPDTIIVAKLTDAYFLKDYTVLVDRDISKAVLVFDKTRNFSFKIEKIGSGPNEYREISSLTVDSANNILYLADNDLMKLFKYELDRSTDVPQKILHYKFDLREIAHFNNSLYYYSGFRRFRSEKSAGLAKLNMDGTVQKLWDFKKTDKPVHGKTRLLFSSSKGLLYAPPYQNNIFRVDFNDKVEIAYKFSNPELYPDYSQIDFSMDRRQALNQQRNNFFYIPRQLVINEEYFFYRSTYRGKLYTGVKFEEDKTLLMSSHYVYSLNDGGPGQMLYSNSKYFVEYLAFEFVGDIEEAEEAKKAGNLTNDKIFNMIKNRDTELVIRQYSRVKK